MKFQLPALPWRVGDLRPFLSPEAIQCHYFGHHKLYVEKLNDLIQKLGISDATLEKLILNYEGALFDNAAQAWNHTFFWYGIAPKPAQLPLECSLMTAIRGQYGSMEGLHLQFLECANNLFGSGWTWLVANDLGELAVLNTANGDNPIRHENCKPIWACDLWEHAYYVDYSNGRKKYAEGAWDHIAWDFVEQNFVSHRIPDMSKLMRFESGIDHIEAMI
jgi:Fe-Mn family superoxide dismutase